MTPRAKFTALAQVYLFWYGNWAPGMTAPTVLPALVSGLTGTQRWRINSEQYWQTGGAHVSGTVTALANVYLGYPQGTTITDVTAVLWAAMTNPANNIPINGDSQYILLASPDVSEGGLCVSYCGYHSYFFPPFGGTPLKFAFIGACTTGVCTPGPLWPSGAPNNDMIGADSMASVLVHEIEEAATDPCGAPTPFPPNPHAPLCSLAKSGSFSDRPSPPHDDPRLLNAWFDPVTGEENCAEKPGLIEFPSPRRVSELPSPRIPRETS